jgi:hypothetical protein
MGPETAFIVGIAVGFGSLMGIQELDRRQLRRQEWDREMAVRKEKQQEAQAEAARKQRQDQFVADWKRRDAEQRKTDAVPIHMKQGFVEMSKEWSAISRRREKNEGEIDPNASAQDVDNPVSLQAAVADTPSEPIQLTLYGDTGVALATTSLSPLRALALADELTGAARRRLAE